MTLEFQSNLLKYFVQMKESKEYIGELDSNLFDLEEHKFAFSLIQTYIEEHKYTPSEVNLIEFFSRKAKELQMPKNTMGLVIDVCKECYLPLVSDTEIYHSTVIDFIQKKRSKLFIEKNLDGIMSGTDLNFSSWAKEFQTISTLGDKGFQEASGGAFLFRDFDDVVIQSNDATPIFLKLVNRMTADRGFYSPQLVSLMSGPKGFKTGTVINIAKHLIMDGKKVFYADFENSYKAINNRVYQSMLECEKHELTNIENQKVLKKMIRNFQKRGGDLRTEYFPAHLTTLDQVDNKLQQLKEEFGWVPDVIIYDYLDLAGCADRSIKEKRLQIQYNYHHAIRLNHKWNTWAITLSQIGKAAQAKMEKDRYIDMKDFAEDFGKAMNVHAAFAMCRSLEDIEKGIGYIIPVAQREGVRFMPGIQCPVYIDESRQIMVEDYDYLEHLEDAIKGKYNGNKTD